MYNFYSTWFTKALVRTSSPSNSHKVIFTQPIFVWSIFTLRQQYYFHYEIMSNPIITNFNIPACCLHDTYGNCEKRQFH